MAQPRPDDKRCTALSRNTGDRCGQWAMKGQTKCRYHGGKSPNALRKVKERQVEKKILTELERKALTGKATQGNTDPLGELQKLTAELVHMKDQLTQRVNDLGDELASYTAEGAETVKVEIDIYLKVIDKLTKTLDIALKHDIEGKKLSLETAKAELVAACLIRVLTALDLPKATTDRAKTLLAEEFQKIGA
ncbi:hypothetical protein [Rothia nasimurium]|uniref:hypothetical protein n=1 Tax=Rothia nasimurium TaxID=85336 RepID=UPI001F377A62|nr:hypothetical protein [Rothia nasimurium]